MSLLGIVRLFMRFGGALLYAFRPRYREPGSRFAHRRPIAVPATSFEQHDVSIENVRVRFIDEGPRDGHALLLVHGLSSRLEEYEDLVANLRKKFRVIVPDLPGSGYSDKPDRPYTMAYYEDVLIALLDHLGVERASVGGGSLGGNIALRIARRWPERFRRVVAWAPAGAWTPYPILDRLTRLPFRAFLFWATVKIQSRFWYSPSWPGRTNALRMSFAYYAEVASPSFIRMYFEMIGDQLRNTHFTEAHTLAKPTLLMWGDTDHGMNMGEGVKRLAKLIPRAELRIFKGARHSLATEIPDAVCAEIEQFLEVQNLSMMPGAPP